MRNFVTALLIVAATAVLGGAAAAQPAPAAPAAPAVEKGQTTVEAFVITAAIAGLFEIESSQMALERTRRDDIKAFAEQMVKDHSAAAEGLAGAVKQDTLNIVLPEKLDAKHLALLTKLHDASQDEFDRAYLDSHLSGHRDAVALFRGFVTGGTGGALGEFAAKALPIVEGHLQRIEAMHKTAVIGAR
jgi:putative membrane protein